MIVKNEGKIIERMLNSVYPFIDSFCICDTGSTDNTVELIHKFANEKGITNYIVYTEPFKNFEYNRTHALHKCIELPQLPTYILLIDADMVLQFGKNIDMVLLKKDLCFQKKIIPDVYFINQGNDAFYYKNARMLKAELLREQIKPKYTGVTHEYLDIPGQRVYVDIVKDVLFILDIGDGGAKTDKFSRDISLLKDGLIAEPNNSRYMFYLANSYKDSGDWENAKEMYDQCIRSNGWVEERWQCHYQLGKGHMARGNPAEAVHNWLLGYHLIPERLENIYELIRYYRENGKHMLAYLFYNIAIKTPTLKSPPVFLFLENDVYDYKIHYEFSVFGYYHNPEKVNMANHSSNVLKRVLVPDHIHANILQNYGFYTSRIYKLSSISNIDELQNMMLLKSYSDIKYYFNGVEMNSSSPSFLISPNGDRLRVCVRKVNYLIRDDGTYNCPGGVITKNHIIEIDISSPRWKYVNHYEMEYNRQYDAFYVGVEDVKLFYNKKLDRIKYIGTRPLPGNNGFVIESGCIQQTETSLSTYDSVFLRHSNNNHCEKNWVYFEGSEGNEKVIYEWNNERGIIIGELSEETYPTVLDDETPAPSRNFIQTHCIEAKNKIPKNIRGSTNGIRIGNEIWFVCHVISHEDLRNYYNLFVVLDATTYEIKSVSDVFKMSERKIEYVLGLAYLPSSGKMLMGYSTMDRTTDYLLVEKDVLIDKLNMQGLFTEENITMKISN
jgi:tetratricopeptide (TPR) repeat protein